MSDHGTANRYKNERCRCPPCRAANTEDVRQQRRRKLAAGLCRHCAASAGPVSRVFCEKHRLMHNEQQFAWYHRRLED